MKGFGGNGGTSEKAGDPAEGMARRDAERAFLESVRHPAHYGGDVPHETVKCLAAWGLESDALLWNAVKYISRAGKKGPVLEDLEKAQWYLERRIASLQGARLRDAAGKT